MLKNFNSKHAWQFVPVHVILDYVAIAYAIISFNFVMAGGILSAHFWLLSNIFLIKSKRKETQARRKVGDEKILPYLYQQSVVLEYFLKRNKTYSTLTNIDLHENINH
jgi:hypothetical protein